MASLNLTKDIICLNETVANTSCEQSVELDYLLPDYYGNIFKLLKTQIIPKIQSQKISGNKLYLDGISAVKVLYLTEGSNDICCIEQTVPFSKTVDLASECENPVISVTPKCYFVNARAVNQRRLDIRGGISCKIKVTTPKETAVLSGGKGNGMQFHITPVSVCDLWKYSTKQFTVTDELELGHTKPAFNSMLNYSCVVSPSDYKIIANKVICKGELLLHMLYTPTGENSIPESMDFSIPVSQIVDMPGIEEDYNCDVSFNVASMNISPKANDEESKVLSCEFVINVFCTADKNKEVLLADDSFSTIYETIPTQMPISTESHLTSMNKTTVLKQSLDCDSDNSILGVYDAFCNLSDCTTKCEDGSLAVNGTLEATAICYQNDNAPFVIDKTFTVEIPMEISDCKDINFTPIVEILDVGYTITSPTSLELRIKIRIGGNVYKNVSLNAISEIEVDEEKLKESSPYALRLYYADKGENIWDIAKKFNTSMTAIMEENSLENELLDKAVMLLIPVVNS